MKVVNIKELSDGGADVEIEFDSKEEHEFYLEISKKMELTLNEFFIRAIQNAVNNDIKENE